MRNIKGMSDYLNLLNRSSDQQRNDEIRKWAGLPERGSVSSSGPSFVNQYGPSTSYNPRQSDYSQDWRNRGNSQYLNNAAQNLQVNRDGIVALYNYYKNDIRGNRLKDATEILEKQVLTVIESNYGLNGRIRSGTELRKIVNTWSSKISIVAQDIIKVTPLNANYKINNSIVVALVGVLETFQAILKTTDEDLTYILSNESLRLSLFTYMLESCRNALKTMFFIERNNNSKEMAEYIKNLEIIYRNYDKYIENFKRISEARETLIQQLKEKYDFVEKMIELVSEKEEITIDDLNEIEDALAPIEDLKNELRNLDQKEERALSVERAVNDIIEDGKKLEIDNRKIGTVADKANTSDEIDEMVIAISGDDDSDSSNLRKELSNAEIQSVKNEILDKTNYLENANHVLDKILDDISGIDEIINPIDRKSTANDIKKSVKDLESKGESLSLYLSHNFFEFLLKYDRESILKQIIRNIVNNINSFNKSFNANESTMPNLFSGISETFKNLKKIIDNASNEIEDLYDSFEMQIEHLSEISDYFDELLKDDEKMNNIPSFVFSQKDNILINIFTYFDNEGYFPVKNKFIIKNKYEDLPSLISDKSKSIKTEKEEAYNFKVLRIRSAVYNFINQEKF